MAEPPDIVVVGGGIAGISVIEGLLQDYDEQDPPFKHITLISTSRLIKITQNYRITGRNLESYDVAERQIEDLDLDLPTNLRFTTIVGHVTQIDSSNKLLIYTETASSRKADRVLKYDILCLCTGSSPKTLPTQDNNIKDKIVVLRDTDTVSSLKARLVDCRNLAVVGNGGISLELVGKVTDCDKTWIIRDNSIGSTYFDPGAAKFFLDSVIQDEQIQISENRARVAYSEFTPQERGLTLGPATGPNWQQELNLKGNNQGSNKLRIIYNDEVQSISSDATRGSPVKICTRHGQQVDCDLVVTAIGVEANKLKVIGSPLELSLRDGGGIIIDREMRSTVEGIYAAGDVASCENWPSSNLWFQMRLWTQARQMGFYAGRCIVAHTRQQDPTIYFNFDCFTHCTSFFGMKLVLLGRYNMQFTTDDNAKKSEALIRVDPGKSYVKILVTEGKVVGAVLVGDTGLEETIENLIHDQIDISAVKDQILNDEFDLNDYFD